MNIPISNELWSSTCFLFVCFDQIVRFAEIAILEEGHFKEKKNKLWFDVIKYMKIS